MNTTSKRALAGLATNTVCFPRRGWNGQASRSYLLLPRIYVQVTYSSLTQLQCRARTSELSALAYCLILVSLTLAPLLLADWLSLSLWLL